MDTKNLLTVKQISQNIGYSTQTIRKIVSDKSNNIYSVIIGGIRFISKEETFKIRNIISNNIKRRTLNLKYQKEDITENNEEHNKAISLLDLSQKINEFNNSIIENNKISNQIDLMIAKDINLIKCKISNLENILNNIVSEFGIKLENKNESENKTS